MNQATENRNYNGHKTDKDTLQRFDAHLTGALSSMSTISRTTDPNNQADTYTPGCVGYASSPGIPFRQERVVIHTGEQSGASYVSISIRNGTHDQGLVDTVHAAMDRFGFPQKNIARTVTSDRPEDGRVTYHIQAE
jgi:hypothetical protein